METYKKQLTVWTTLDDRYLIIAPDPKREGLYKSTEVQIKNGKTLKFSDLYGKKNQAEIQRLIKVL